MAETLYIPAWTPPVVSDDWKAKQLDQWQRGNTSTEQLKGDIKYYRNYRKLYAGRLDKLRQYVAEHRPGFNEWIDQRIVRLEADVQWYDDVVVYLTWLLKQPILMPPLVQGAKHD